MSRAGAWNKFSRRIPRNVDPGRGQRWVTVKNMSGETIPAYAAMEPYGVDRDGNILVRKPTQDDSNKCILNGGSVIGIGDYGTGTNHMATWAYYEVSDGEPAVGEMLGTRSGYWKLHRGYEGFLAWGGASEMGIGIVKVQRDLTCRVAGGYHYGYYPNVRGRGFCCGCARFDCETNTPFPDTLECTLTVDCIGTTTETVYIDNSGLPPYQSFDACRGLSTTYTGGRLTIADPQIFEQTTDCDNLTSAPALTSIEESLEIVLRCMRGTTNPLLSLCDGTGDWYAHVVWSKVIAGERYSYSACGYIDVASCDPLYLADTGTITCESSYTCTGSGAFPLSQPIAHYTLSGLCDGGSGQVEFAEV